eukprot:scpid67796/ scgid34638/ 
MWASTYLCTVSMLIYPATVQYVPAVTADGSDSSTVYMTTNGLNMTSDPGQCPPCPRRTECDGDNLVCMNTIIWVIGLILGLTTLTVSFSIYMVARMHVAVKRAEACQDRNVELRNIASVETAAAADGAAVATSLVSRISTVSDNRGAACTDRLTLSEAELDASSHPIADSDIQRGRSEGSTASKNKTESPAKKDKKGNKKKKSKNIAATSAPAARQGSIPAYELAMAPSFDGPNDGKFQIQSSSGKEALDESGTFPSPSASSSRQASYSEVDMRKKANSISEMRQYRITRCDEVEEETELAPTIPLKFISIRADEEAASQPVSGPDDLATASSFDAVEEKEEPAPRVSLKLISLRDVEKRDLQSGRDDDLTGESECDVDKMQNVDSTHLKAHDNDEDDDNPPSVPQKLDTTLLDGEAMLDLSRQD